MSKSKQTTISLAPSGTLLTALFVVLKVTGYISWSWWWVFAPIWIPAAIALLILVGVLVLFVVAAILE